MKSRSLHLDSLEAREVPATFGTPWLDGDQITVSFAPDTALVDGVTSKLKGFLNSKGLTDAVWQGEILRAMQTWSNYANINFGVVSDNGSSIGTVGSFQGDGKFGDIRIFAVPLSSNVCAITLPPDQKAGTRAGDIILNTNINFGVGANAQYDLYSVMLQEVGHALGIANNTDPLSPMYESYGGVRTGLAASDIDAIRKLYGNRTYNFLEFFGNNSSSSATTISEASKLAEKTTVTLIGDLDVNTDDWYKFTVPTGVSSLTIQLQTGGYSLAQGALTVLNSSQVPLATSSASGAGKNVSLSVPVVAGSTYYIRIADAVGTAFTSGLYRLRLIPDGSTNESVSFAGYPNFVENNLNNTWDKATPLLDQDASDWKAYSLIATLPANDVDHFRVTAPAGTTQEKVILTAAIRAYSGVVAPMATVLDAAGNLVPSTVAADGNGFYAVEFGDATPSATYILKVQSRTGVLAGTDYKIDVSFRNQPKELASLFEGTTTKTAATATTSITINRSVVMAFDLSAVITSGGSVSMSVYNSTGNKVFSLVANSGDTVSGNVLLNAGTYTISYKINRPTGRTGSATISLRGAVLTDPIGITSSTITSGIVTDYTISSTDSAWLSKTAYPALDLSIL